MNLRENLTAHALAVGIAGTVACAHTSPYWNPSEPPKQEALMSKGIINEGEQPNGSFVACSDNDDVLKDIRMEGGGQVPLSVARDIVMNNALRKVMGGVAQAAVKTRNEIKTSVKANVRLVLYDNGVCAIATDE